MPNIFERKITAKNIKQVWEADTKNKDPFIGEMFYTDVQQAGLDINLLKGKEGLPVALVAANWDTDVLYRDRIGFEGLQAELPFFKEAYKVSEKLRQKIITSQEQYTGAFFQEIFRDSTALLLGARVTAERMRMQILGTGTISIQENGVDKQYNYGFDTSKQLKTETVLWNAEGAKPLASFIAQIKAYKKYRKNLHVAKYAVMGEEAFDKLINDATVTEHFQKLAIPVPFPTDEMRRAYVEATTNVTIILADQYYVKARDFKNQVATPYYPADRYTLLSTLDLGETIYGTTPEEADLLSGDSNVLSCEIVDNGVAITTWKETDPVCVSVKVSEVVAPSCPNIEDLYIVKVL
mgnify:CR=1 FL=1